MAAIAVGRWRSSIALMMKGIDTPAMVKDSVGWGAMVAVSSVLMAQRGFTGIESLFSDVTDSKCVSTLGAQYEMLNVYFKPYGCCRWAQPAIAGALQIAQEHKLAPSNITQIRVRTFSEAVQLSCAPPENTEQAQYNLAYPVAAALVDGELGPRQMLPPRIYDETILGLAARVEPIIAPEYDQLFPEKGIADVQVTMLDGRIFSATGKEARWEPPNSPTDAELESKFHRLVAPVLGRMRSAALAEMIWGLDHVRAVGELIDLCVHPQEVEPDD